MTDKMELLELLEKDCTTSSDELALMLGSTAEEVSEMISQLKSEGIILGNSALINWEKTDRELVEALIEVHIAPQRGQGFDKIAERIYNYPEVKECFLMSGGYDLKLIIEGKTMREVASFVSQKLSTVENVISTSTHFVLKKYKEKGTVFETDNGLDREAVVL